MNEKSGFSASFVGSIPQHYDSGLGPNIFADYAEDIASRAAALRPAHVLEMAAGTGIATRKLRDVLPKDAKLTATDLNPPMLEVNAAKFRPGEAVEFKQADGTALPFADRSFDLVVCQFGVMFFPDKDKGYREAFRVLQPGGSYLFSVWDSARYNPYIQVTIDVVASFFEQDPPLFFKTPVSYPHIDPIKESLLAAGFRGMEIAVIGINKRVADMSAFARATVFGTPYFEQIKARGGDHERIAQAMVEAYRKAFGDPGISPIQAIVVSAKRPE